MATRRLLDADSGVPAPPSKCNCSVVALDALSRKNTADVPGTPVIVCDAAPASGIGVTGYTGVPDRVKNPQGTPLHVSPVCPMRKMSAKLKLGVVVRTSLAV